MISVHVMRMNVGVEWTLQIMYDEAKTVIVIAFKLV